MKFNNAPLISHRGSNKTPILGMKSCLLSCWLELFKRLRRLKAPKTAASDCFGKTHGSKVSKPTRERLGPLSVACMADSTFQNFGERVPLAGLTQPLAFFAIRHRLLKRALVWVVPALQLLGTWGLGWQNNSHMALHLTCDIPWPSMRRYDERYCTWNAWPTAGTWRLVNCGLLLWS